MNRLLLSCGLALTGIAAAAPAVFAEVTVERVSCLNQPNCYRLSNGTVEAIVTTDVGPRIIRYGFIGGENLLAELPDMVVRTTLGEWRPWGGHRLWTAPEGMPRSYAPDNAPVQFSISGSTITLTQPVEDATGIQKVLTVSLADQGTALTIDHRLTNRNLWAVELAPWALSIMNGGGTVIIPQEPRRSHDEALQPVRAMTLWAYTDLSDPRWRIGPAFIRLSTDESRPGSQKIGVANTRGWAGYLDGGTLFVKRFAWDPTATYPDFGVNTETYTAGSFIELETLGPLQALAPGESVSHQERWWLFRDVAPADSDEALARTLAPLLAQTR